MDFEYNDQNELIWQGLRLQDHVKAHSPAFYLYSKSQLERRAKLITSGLKKTIVQPQSVHYALKANNFKEVLGVLLSEGLSVDVVSGAELQYALNCGFKAEHIVFSGVGKTLEELTLAIQSEVHLINVESLPELKRISQIATSLNKKVRIGIRINPNVKSATHDYISTGSLEHKFGLEVEKLPEALQLIRLNPRVVWKAISVHIGSQLTEFGSFIEAVKGAIEVIANLKSAHQIEILDVGGGVGINYEGSEETDEIIWENYLKALLLATKDFQGKLMFEPGRFLVARCGILLAEVQYVKQTSKKEFVIVNSGMNHLIRPALYESFHRIFPLKNRAKKKVYDIVGPVCETSDFFALNRECCEIREEDWIAIADVGAYGRVMASQYNLFSLPQEKLV